MGHQESKSFIQKFDFRPMPSLTVRELQEADIRSITDYWSESPDDFLVGMGVDLKKLPSREGFENMLQRQISLPYKEKNSLCLIWEVDGEAIGHCNTNPTVFGDEAYMHLHTWQGAHRQKGLGTDLLKLSVPYFFEKLELKTLYSQPYTLNPAPNRALEKVGFEFVKEFTTVPGSINFEQSVKLWRMGIENALVGR